MGIKTCNSCGASSDRGTLACPHCLRLYPPRGPLLTPQSVTKAYRTADHAVQRWGGPAVMAAAIAACFIWLPDWSGQRAAQRATEQADIDRRVAERRAQAASAAQLEAANRKRLEAEHLDAVRQVVEGKIAAGQILIGMTAEQARRAWGNPDSINSTVSSRGTSEQWVYKHGRAANSYLYVDNGIVKSMQTSK